MAVLNEIKGRINSVKSTLKITSAMKLVASSKLHKAQADIEAVRPYEQTLEAIMSEVDHIPGSLLKSHASSDSQVAVVAVASNSSLCGAFNSNVIHKTIEVCRACASVQMFAIGKRVADAMRTNGYPSEGDYNAMIARPDYKESEKLSQVLIRRFLSGEFSRVVLVYNKFVSTSVQTPVVEQYLPYVASETAFREYRDDFIFEPAAEIMARKLVPHLLALKLHAALLDSAAAEHAARTIAMQTASENAERLLSELTLEYNKGRQEKITTELLDLEGGEGASD